MARQQMIDALMWTEGGMGFGVCAVATAMAWQMSKPKTKADDLKTVVAISGQPADYTDEELEKLVAFSQRRTARYDKMFSVRMGANLICIAKTGPNSWMRKRLSWEHGPMFSPTLDEAMAVFERDEH